MPKKQPRKPMQVASDSESEYDDEIQAYHKEKDKILLNSDQEDVEDSEEEEVYGLDESDSEDEEITLMQQQMRQIKRNKVKKKLGSDLEDDTEDEALPDSRAWGNKKSWFMGGDVRDNKIILSGSEDEAGAAALEEEELRKLRERRLQNLTEEDYFPPSLKMMLDKMNDKGKKKQKSSKKSDDEVEEGPSDKTKTKKKKKKETKKKKSSVEGETGEVEKIKIKADLSEEAEYERMKQMHPEFLPLVEDFKSKMQEFRTRIIPLMGLVKKGKIDGVGATYIRMKYHIISNYLICGGFYMYFVVKKTPRLHHHPVMKRLLEFQQFYNRLVPTDQRVKPELDQVLELLRQGKEVRKITCTQLGLADTAEVPASGKKKARKAMAEDTPVAKKRKIQDRQEDDDDFEEEDEVDDDGEEELGNMDEDEAEEDDDEDGQERRAITKEMEKNKGLTAHKKKDQKNPRVKHRKKYRRALIRRKGQVRDYKAPKTAYSGEMTGIRAGIIRSRKLK